MYPYNIQNFNNMQNYMENTNSNNRRPEIVELEEAIGPSVEADDKILTMLNEAITDEMKGYEYYKRLQVMFDDKDKETVRHISLDEMKHRKILEDLYQRISGTKAPTFKVDDIQISRNLLVEIAKSIMNEYDDSEFYRKLYFMLENPEYRDMIFEIMTDEQNHAGKLNYLYSKYK